MTLALGDASDGELAALALAGRQAAYTELLARHRVAVFRLARATTSDDDAALEVTQEAFIAAFAALKSYDSSRPFKTWMSRIALNKCRDWARRRAVRRFFSFALPIEAADAISDDSVPVDRQLTDKAELARVRAAIAKLPSPIREPLVLRTIEGLTQAETAEILGISEKAVETRLYRARTRLTEYLRG
jgi:RNA polymerase sigma-70 factor (ECF subfamily)